jgi:UPF0755 protein
MNHKKKKNKRYLLISIIILFVISLISLTYLTFWYSYYSHNNDLKIINIPHNSTVKEIADILYEKDVIFSKTFFLVATQLLGWGHKLYSGSYSMRNGLSNYDVLKILTDKEQQIIHKVTIREGLTARQIAKLLEDKLNINHVKFLNLVKDTNFIKTKCLLHVKSLEGFLFPKTYNFYWEPTEEDAILAMTKEFRKFFNDNLRARCKELKLKPEQVITLASIVEGEAKLDNERAIIAGVYFNRLKKNMNLEADPTIQYVLPDGPRRLFNSDYKYQSLYNTYLHSGLPPGPINNPGEKSILAALYPNHHNYLYFVARGDGSHYFSESYNEHVRAKLKRKKQ